MIPRFTRRSFLASSGAVAAIPLGEWLKGCTPQSETTPPAGRFMRREANDPAAAATLQAYRRGVRAMMDRPPQDPTSWAFQANIHGVNNRATAITTLFRETPGLAEADRRTLAERRAVAERVFSTCTHTGATVTLDFLTWHRMYIYFFERIVRSASGDPSFSMPYWDYSNPERRALPLAFRTPANERENALYRAHRNAGVNDANDGRFLEDEDVDIAPALRLRSFTPVAQDRGFSVFLEDGVHGQVHVRIGNAQGMGSVPFAARDPIFWLHHCNIDRLWSSWTTNGGLNPTAADWNNRSYAFADENGRLVTMTTRDILQHAGQLNYEYDRLETLQVAATRTETPGDLSRMMSLQLAETVATEDAQPLRLGPGPTRLQLAPDATRSITPGGLRERIQALPPERRVILVLEDIVVTEAPGVTYRVFLNLPQGEAAEADSPYFIGPLNVFGLVVDPAEGGHDQHGGGGGVRTFDVTEVVKAQISRNLWTTDDVSVTIAPRGAPQGASNPVVRRTRLVIQ